MKSKIKHLCLATCIAVAALSCRAKQSESETQSIFNWGPEVGNLEEMPALLLCFVIAPENDVTFPEDVREPDFWQFEKVGDGYEAKRLDGSRNQWGRTVELKKSTKGISKITFREGLLVLENNEHRFELATTKPESRWAQKRPSSKVKPLRNCK